jgi:hypothetical protein
MRQTIRLAALACLFLVPAAFQGCGSNAEMMDPPDSGAGGIAMTAGTSGTAGTAGAAGTAGIPMGQGGSDEDAGEPSGPEVQTSVCPTYTPLALTTADTLASQPALIWTGTHFLAVWSAAPAGMPGASNIVGALLNPDGTRAGGADLLIADTPNDATSPELTVVPGAEPSFNVVFEDCPECPTGSSVGSVVLDAQGAPKTPVVTLSPPVKEQRRPYVAAGLGGVYATFRDVIPAAPPPATRTVARVVKLDPTGAAIGEGFVADQASDGHYPHIAIGPDRLALIYQRKKPMSEIVLGLFNADLAFEKEVVLRTGIAGAASNPVVQWNTSRWVVAWEDERQGEDEAQIYSTVVEADGSRIGPTGCVGTQCAPQPAYGENGNWPAIASGNLMTSLIGFYGYPGQHVFLARVEASGQLKMGQVVLGVGKFPSVAYNDKGEEYGVVYEDTQNSRIMFGRFKCMN